MESIEIRQSKKRDIRFDIAKGIGILLVVIGHVGEMKHLQPIIYSFHMPLFFMISGYFFKKKKFDVFIKKRIKSLIIPYWFTSILLVLMMLIKQIYYQNYHVALFLRDNLMRIVLGYSQDINGMAAVGPLWFLLALFFSELFYLLFSQKEAFTTLFVIAAFCFGVWSHHHLGVFPFSLQPALCATLFLHIGFLCKTHHWLDEMNWQRAVLALFIWFLSRKNTLFVMTLDMGGTFYADLLPTIIGSCAGSYLIIYFATHCAQHLNNPFSALLDFFGRYSLVFLCFHSLEQCYIWPVWWKVVKYTPIFKTRVQNYFVVFLKIVWAASGTIISLQSKVLCRIFRIKKPD